MALTEATTSPAETPPKKGRRAMTPATLLKHVNAATDEAGLLETDFISALTDHLKNEVVNEAMKG